MKADWQVRAGVTGACGQTQAVKTQWRWKAGAGASEEFPSEGGRLSPLSALSHTAVSLVQGRAAAKAGLESQQKGEHVRVPAAEFPPLPGKWVSADPLKGTL